MHYQNHLVAFLDILGFSQICLSSETSEAERERLNEIFILCEQIKDSFRDILGKEKIDSFIISDSIILTLKLENQKPSIGEIRNFVLAAGQYQYHLAKNGIFLRGGISCGSLFVNKQRKQVIGPALIQAYNLERTVAKYPRIVGDVSLITKADKENVDEFKNELNEIEWQSRLRPFYSWETRFDDISLPRVPHDVPLVVDFIRSSQNIDVLEISKHVSKNLNGSINHYEKYRWLADYLLVSFHQIYSGLGPNRDSIHRLLA